MPEEDVAYRIVEQPPAGLGQGINKSQPSSGDGSGSGSLDKIRELLFGNQIREYDRRFSRLEERLLKEYTELRNDTSKRLDSLENYLHKEIESLIQQVKTEKSERETTHEELVRELKELLKSFERKLAQLDEQTSNSQRELRQQILYQSKSIDDAMRQKSQEILASLERETQELRTDKTDRSTLAAIFAELAVRLNNQGEISGDR